MIYLFFLQWESIYEACKERGLIPAEIRSEEENEAATRLDKRMNEAFQDGNPVLLGATDGLVMEMKWYWMSQIMIEPRGSAIYNKGKVVGSAFHKFIWTGTTVDTGAPQADYDCIHIQDRQDVVFWDPVKCKSKHVMCEARSISGVSVNLTKLRSFNPSSQALGDM